MTRIDQMVNCLRFANEACTVLQVNEAGACIDLEEFKRIYIEHFEEFDEDVATELLIYLGICVAKFESCGVPFHFAHAAQHLVYDGDAGKGMVH